MYGVDSGQVKIFKVSPDGREQILRIVGPGECFNEEGAIRLDRHRVIIVSRAALARML